MKYPTKYIINQITITVNNYSTFKINTQLPI